MPDKPPAAAKSGGKKEILGQPVWFWAAGAGILAAIGVYIWWRNRQNSQAASQAAPASGQMVPYSSFQGFVMQQQASPKTVPTCPSGYWWDPDDNGGQGKCVKGKPPKKDTTTVNSAGTTVGS